MKDFLFQIFSSLHFYRNNTKNKVIPVSITRAVHIFFASFMVSYGSETLVKACDNIQPGILFMILKSEGDKVKYCSAPPRDRKYVIAAYTNLIMEKSNLFLEDSIQTIISSLVELCNKGQGGSFQVAS